jgi:hypothetical protein
MNNLTNLKYISEYTTYNIGKYYRERGETNRFDGCTKEVIQQIFSPAHIEKIAQTIDPNFMRKAKPLTHKIQSSMPSQKKELNNEEWIAQEINSKGNRLDLDPNIADKYPEFVNFLRAGRLFNHMVLYRHVLEYSNNGQDPMILVDGKHIPLKKFLKKFEIKEVGFETQIIHKKTQKRWFYLERGLIEYDPHKQMKPFITKKSTDQFEVTFFFANEGLNRHAWMNFKDSSGQVISVGALANGSINVPDPYEYGLQRKKGVTFAVDKKTYKNLVKLAKEEQAVRDDQFNWLKDNCSSFADYISQHLFSEDSKISATSTIKEHNTLVHRVKAFVIAKELAKELKKPQTLAKVENLRDQMKEKKIENRTEEIDQIVEIIEKVFHGEENEEFGKILKNIFTEKSGQNYASQFLDSLIETAKKSEKIVLQDKIFNLFFDIFDASQELKIDHPSVLFNRMKKQKDAKVFYIERQKV